MGVNLQQTGGGAGGGTTVNTKAKVTSLWLDSFTAATGLFTASQPAASDLSVAALANGITATTQAALSADTKVATDAYVDNAVAAATLTIASPGYLMLPVERTNTTGSYTTSNLAANAVWAFMINVRDTITITDARFSALVNTAATATNFYVGIYSLAGNLLLEMKFPLTSNQVGVVSGTLTPASFKLTPGSYLYVFGCEISVSTLTIAGLDLNNIPNQIVAMMNAKSNRLGFKTAMISSGHLVGSGLTPAALTAASTTLTSLVTCIVSA